VAVEGLKNIIGVPKVQREQEAVSKSRKDKEQRGKKRKKKKQNNDEKRKGRIDIRA
jgi:hypothetical protein